MTTYTIDVAIDGTLRLPVDLLKRWGGGPLTLVDHGDSATVSPAGHLDAERTRLAINAVVAIAEEAGVD